MYDTGPQTKDTWAVMTPRERRWAVWSDVAVALIGAGLLYWALS